MRDYDAVFLAVAAASLIGELPRRSLGVLAPLFAWACGLLPDGGVGIPYAAAFALLVPRACAPVVLLLVLPGYEHAADAVRAGALWWLGLALLEALEDRLPADHEVPEWFAGAPLRLTVCAILYFALLPLSYVFR